MWKLSTSHSAAGVIDPSSLIASASARYAPRSTRPLSATRRRIGRPVRACSVTVWAAASDSPCCSRRATLNSSATIGSDASIWLRAWLRIAMRGSRHCWSTGTGEGAEVLGKSEVLLIVDRDLDDGRAVDGQGAHQRRVEIGARLGQDSGGRE